MASSRLMPDTWRLLRGLGQKSQRRSLSYADTVENLRIKAETRVILQGFTGKQATFDAKQSIEYGTKIVGGVRPGKDGEHLGLPVVPSMKAVSFIPYVSIRILGGVAKLRQAMERLKPDATAVYVAAPGAAAAIEEAIESEIPLIVAVAEFIPLHDMLRVQDVLRTQSKSRLVGPNCPGMINPHARCRIGFPPIPFFQAGSVGIVSKSGTLSYETVASTTRAGLGQSLVVGIGGDPLPGTDFVDVLKVFEHDENTKGIIIVGEIGGTAELRAAEWIRDYKKRSASPKPIMALIAGLQAPPGVVMGHAGAVFRDREEETARRKIQMLEEAGVVLTDHPEKFGNIMRAILDRNYQRTTSLQQNNQPFDLQKRTLHTSTRPSRFYFNESINQPLRRGFRVPSYQVNLAFKLRGSLSQAQRVQLQFFPNRLTYMPCLRVKDTTGENVVPLAIEAKGDEGQAANSKSGNSNWRVEISYPYNLDASACKKHLVEEMGRASQTITGDNQGRQGVLASIGATTGLAEMAWSFAKLFKEKEASMLTIDAAYDAIAAEWKLLWIDAEFDDSAYKSSKRQANIYEHRDTSAFVPEAVEAERHGIVYVRFPGDNNLGTLVNGAGLAMNTVDALRNLGGSPANFLDTGGKATSDTVSQAFRTILTDSRVNIIFVNIFGGLTLGDMIAKGVIKAYKEVGIQVPVVVRLRGTNEKEGQKLIAESGLPIEAFDDFGEAATRAIDLGNRAKGHGMPRP